MWQTNNYFEKKPQSRAEPSDVMLNYQKANIGLFIGT